MGRNCWFVVQDSEDNLRVVTFSGYTNELYAKGFRPVDWFRAPNGNSAIKKARNRVDLFNHYTWDEEKLQ